jgi:hypothetical protein
MRSDGDGIAGSQQHGDLIVIIARLRDGLSDLVRDVAADLGRPDPPQVAPTVAGFLDMITSGPGLGEAARLRLRQEGATAARQGQTLAALMDAYLSTAWVTWDHALGLSPPLGVPAMRSLGAALLRAGDDIAAELSDGYTTAERALAATAGAARQAILDELLSGGAADPAAVSRLLRRATLAGLDPTQPHHVLVVRPSGDPEGPAELAQELDRRLARDPARRAFLVAARGPDVVAVAPPPWREDRPFRDVVADLSDDPWWGVVAGPVALERVASAYADAVDALRVAPNVLPAASLVDVEALALERALVADPVLAAAGAERWLSPLARASRGGEALIRTLGAWLDSGHSVTATARVLGVAPRTVSYRLDRIAAILGVRELGPETVARLSAALLVARVLGTDRVASTR